MKERIEAITALAAEAEAILRDRDPVLAGVMDQVGACQWPEYVMEPFDALVWSILGQQISVHAAASITARLAQQAARPFAASALARLSDDAYRSAGLSRNKARTVRGLSDAVVTGELDLPALETAPDEQVSAALCRLHGIGPWTAEMFLIFGLGRPDVFSGGDLGLRKAIAIAWNLKTTPQPAACVARAQAWRPYRTIAAWYLWRLVDPR